MFFLDFISLFVELDLIRYIFIAFTLYGVMCCLQKLILGKVV